jgi:hypothetical protein
MSEFWISELGELSGSAEDAFTPKPFGVIPDGTMALAKIERMFNVTHEGKKRIEIDWLITDGDFKGQHVFHKIHAYDEDSKKRHRALNLLMLIFKMFEVKPKDNNPPTDDFLMIFAGKVAGIKIQEWEFNGKNGNWVSEVHAAKDFKCVTGTKMEVTHTNSPVDSAFSRNPKGVGVDLESDIPF